MQFPNTLCVKDEKLTAIISAVKQATQNIWSTPLHQYYTSHDVKHSEKIISIVGALLEPLRDELNEFERFILICAIYLHDIGMQAPSYAGLEKKDKYTRAELDRVREQHHEISEKMICDSVMEGSTVSCGLEGCNPNLVKYIALIAKYHRRYNIEKLKDQSVAGRIIRLPLLACMIRLGDELDVDSDRVNMDVLKQVDVCAADKFHWWGHYYVQSLEITKGRIKLYFCFPEKYRDNGIVDMIKRKTVDAVEDRFDTVYTILDGYGLRLFRKIEVAEDDYSPIQRLMPDDLVQYLESKSQDNNKANGQVMQVKKNIRFVYKFVSMGATADEASEYEDLVIKENRIFLDTGGVLKKGVMDMHGLEHGIRTSAGNTYRSTTGAVSACPNFVLDNITEAADKVEIVVHKEPDFDCFAAAYLTRELIVTGRLPDNYQHLVAYTESLDKGLMELDKGFINTPFSAANTISYVVRADNPNAEFETLNLLILERGLQLIEHIMGRLPLLTGEDRSLFNYSILQEGCEFQKEFDFIRDDVKKYMADLNGSFEVESADGAKKACPVCERVRIKLPVLNKTRDDFEIVYGLVWNREPSCILHKYWARGDRKSPDRKGYTFTFIPLLRTQVKLPIQNESTAGSIPDTLPVCRVVISVNPASNVHLEGLGELLEQFELQKEEQLFGAAKSIWRDRKNVRKNVEYSTNSDPWYDGKAFDYTIVDAPSKRYSLLTIEEIKKIVFDHYEVEVIR